MKRMIRVKNSVPGNSQQQAGQDITRPESVGAQQTSRPVITNNQPVGSDPMMTENPSTIESRIINKMPKEKLEQELNSPDDQNAEKGTLHQMYPASQMVGQVKHVKKRKVARMLILIIGFVITIAGVGYYFLVFLEQ